MHYYFVNQLKIIICIIFRLNVIVILVFQCNYVLLLMSLMHVHRATKSKNKLMMM